MLSFLPIILIGVLFGLAMDYQVFIASGMREAFMHGEPAKHAVRTGFSHAAAVVTAAAIIMVSVFSGFIFSHLNMVRPLGFAMAFGVLVDAFVVRMTIVPAVMYLLGGKAWWLPALAGPDPAGRRRRGRQVDDDGDGDGGAGWRRQQRRERRDRAGVPPRIEEYLRAHRQPQPGRLRHC